MENKCQNCNAKYVKELFATNKTKEPKGKRLLISNGGYGTKNSNLYFGYRCYYDSKAGVLSDMLYQMETAILYSECCDRVLLIAQQID